MTTYYLKLILLSDTTFGRGDGVAGFVDTEVEHDQYGLPYLHGRGVKGLLTAQCADILGALETSPAYLNLEKAATRLFGEGGSNLDTNGALYIGPALLPNSLRQAVRQKIEQNNEQNKLRRTDMLAALTTTRRQTQIDDQTGAAKDKSLRSTRVLIRELEFEAALVAERNLDLTEQGLLAACVKATRRVGSHRARGLGQVKTELLDSTRQLITDLWLKHFECEVIR